MSPITGCTLSCFQPLSSKWSYKLGNWIWSLGQPNLSNTQNNSIKVWKVNTFIYKISINSCLIISFNIFCVYIFFLLNVFYFKKIVGAILFWHDLEFSYNVLISFPILETNNNSVKIFSEMRVLEASVSNPWIFSLYTFLFVSSTVVNYVIYTSKW